MSIREYERITPYELMLIVEEHNFKRQQQREDLVTQAYYTAALYRAKRMPSLKKMLEDMKPKKLQPQTDEQMFDVVKRLQVQFGMGD